MADPSRYDPSSARDTHRISVIYSVDDNRTVADNFANDLASAGVAIGNYLRLDRLRPYYDQAERQLPRILAREEVAGADIGIDCDATINRGFLWLVALPHGAHLLTLTVEIACTLEKCIAIMEDLHHQRVRVAGVLGGDKLELCRGAQERFGPAGRAIADKTLGLDVYQILFVRRDEQARLKRHDGTINTAAISSLIYRWVSDYRHDTLRVLYPGEANRGPYLAAAGPYVSVTAGLQGYVENAALISAMQYVGSTALLREIRLETFDELRRLRRLSREEVGVSLRTRRSLFAQMTQRLERLQLELSFGVEAFDSIASVVPSLRVLDYHAALFAAANTAADAQSVGTMLRRLEQGISSEIRILQAEERSADERRRAVRSVALSLISIVAIPLGIVFGFFGMTTREIRADESFLSLDTYYGIYVFLASVLVAAGLAALALVAKFMIEDRQDQRRQVEVFATLRDGPERERLHLEADGAARVVTEEQQ